MGILGFPQNDIWVLVSWIHVCPKSRSWWVLWIRVCLGLIHAPKCSNYALTNLLFGLCKFMWVIQLLVNLPSPIPKLQHALLPPKCYKPKSVPQFLLLPLFTFGLIVESIKGLKGVSFKQKDRHKNTSRILWGTYNSNCLNSYQLVNMI